MKIKKSIVKFWNESLLNRLVLLTLTALIVVGVAFGGYYYWDRYVYLGDKSPLELGVDHLEKMVRENPQDPQARLALAQFYFENGMFAEAIDQAGQVLKAYPGDETALFLVGLSQVQIGQSNQAVEPLEQFAAKRRESPMAQTDAVLEASLYYLGVSYVNLYQSSQAIAILSEALRINPTDADAIYQLGLAYAQDGQPELAIEKFQSAVRFVPDFLEAYQGMTESYAVMAMPDHVNYARGMEAFSREDHQQAREYLQKSAANLPEFAPVHLGLALADEQLGDLHTAKANLERVLELDPGNFMANHALGRVNLSLGENE